MFTWKIEQHGAAGDIPVHFGMSAVEGDLF